MGSNPEGRCLGCEGRIWTRSPLGKVSGRRCPHRLGERLWNGDEDVATPFTAPSRICGVSCPARGSGSWAEVVLKEETHRVASAPVVAQGLEPMPVGEVCLILSHGVRTPWPVTVPRAMILRQSHVHRNHTPHCPHPPPDRGPTQLVPQPELGLLSKRRPWPPVCHSSYPRTSGTYLIDVTVHPSPTHFRIQIP
jgi:hypothetical protein